MAETEQGKRRGADLGPVPALTIDDAEFDSALNWLDESSDQLAGAALGASFDEARDLLALSVVFHHLHLVVTAAGATRGSVQ